MKQCCHIFKPLVSIRNGFFQFKSSVLRTYNSKRHPQRFMLRLYMR
ncbi:hypothetical protein SPHINGOT1_80146 [Sphingomonas sp. T1]|nr:hypothetical protein SPHINGOT1_80146 [Sphingomonas sp. T1]